VDVEILPEPTDDERRAILAALRAADERSPYTSAWRLAALRDGALAEEPGGDAGVVEP
jgi:hypothetical protein